MRTCTRERELDGRENMLGLDEIKSWNVDLAAVVTIAAILGMRACILGFRLCMPTISDSVNRSQAIHAKAFCLFDCDPFSAFA